MTLPASKLGDKGQRYLVSARWSGIWREVGYCDSDYEKFADAFFQHPAVDKVYVIDRQHPDLVGFLKGEVKCRTCGAWVSAGCTECHNCGVCGPRTGGAPPLALDPSNATIYKREK